MLPNDVFKRPGPHHAYEVDLEELERIRAAIDPLEELGFAEPLAQLTNSTVQDILEWGVLERLHYQCTVGDDFGLQTYGPMLSCGHLSITFGTLLIPRRDARVHPISHVWFERNPYMPQCIATAEEILAHVPILLDPPAWAWDYLLADLHENDQNDDTPEEERPAALMARWRGEYRGEVERFRDRLVEIAQRHGSVMTWEDAQGWL